jgi:hypothetical protein
MKDSQENDVPRRKVGRPKKEEQTVQFTLVLPPRTVQRVKMFKILTGQTISQMTAKALEVFTNVSNFFSNTMDLFLTDEFKTIAENEKRRVQWAEEELKRFKGVENGMYEFIETLKQRKTEFEKLKWKEARDWNLNDVDEQINRVHEDIQLNERRMTYYRNIIKMQGKI